MAGHRQAMVPCHPGTWGPRNDAAPNGGVEAAIGRNGQGRGVRFARPAARMYLGRTWLAARQSPHATRGPGLLESPLHRKPGSIRKIIGLSRKIFTWSGRKPPGYHPCGNRSGDRARCDSRRANWMVCSDQRVSELTAAGRGGVAEVAGSGQNTGQVGRSDSLKKKKPLGS